MILIVDLNLCKNTSLFSTKAVIDTVVFKAVVNYRETNHKNHCGLQVLQSRDVLVRQSAGHYNCILTSVLKY